MLFFYTTCIKLDLAHAVLFERVQSGAFRMECEKTYYIFELYTYRNGKFTWRKLRTNIMAEVFEFFLTPSP